MEMREDWHNTFTDYMYEAAGSNVQPQPRQQQQQQPQQQQSRTIQQQNQQQRPQQQNNQNQQQNTQQQRPQQQSVNRPDPKFLPFSLTAIMNGTHSSFNESA